MKKLIYLLILAVTVVTGGCSKNNSTPRTAYSIKGHTDNSTTWIESKRNTLLFHLIYYPSLDVLSQEGVNLKRFD